MLAAVVFQCFVWLLNMKRISLYFGLSLSTICKMNVNSKYTTDLAVVVL